MVGSENSCFAALPCCLVRTSLLVMCFPDVVAYHLEKLCKQHLLAKTYMRLCTKSRFATLVCTIVASQMTGQVGAFDTQAHHASKG